MNSAKLQTSVQKLVDLIIVHCDCTITSHERRGDTALKMILSPEHMEVSGPLHTPTSIPHRKLP